MRFPVIVASGTVHFDNGIGLCSFGAVTIETGGRRLCQRCKDTGFIGVVSIQQFGGFGHNISSQAAATIFAFR